MRDDVPGTSRAPRVLFAIVLAALVAQAMCSAYVLAALFDMRAFQTGWYDHAWQLEIAWQARQGDWSGRDFHYPRGPLWQAVAWLASRPWREQLAMSDTLAAITLAFRLASLSAVAWIAWRRVERPWTRVLVLLVLATLSFGAGVPTFRALLSSVVILVYVPIEPEQRASWPRALAAALLCGSALLLSFDRFAIALLGVAAASIAEWLARRRTDQRPRVALARARSFVLALALVVVAIALLAVIAGADPLAYVAGQRQLAAGYATGMRTPWYVGVPPANVIALFVVAMAIGLWALAARQPPYVAAWIAGALPSALFGLVTSDQGHVFMAILPLVCALVLVAASASAAAVRGSAGVLAAVAILGWLGTYPNAISLRPADFTDAWAALRGSKRPDRGFTSDHARAIAWTRGLVAREHPRCIAAWPSLSIVHALADVPGPTELAIRWNDDMQRELARRIEREDCPVYLHHVLSFDDIGGAWFLGPDFVVLAERYRFERRVGAALVSMRRRSEPLRAPRRALPIERIDRAIELPGELVIPLGAEVSGESVVRLDYDLDLTSLRAQLGGIPLGEWRFEHRGLPVGRWQTLHHLRAGVGSVYLAPDPEAVEWRWMAGTRIGRRVVADTLRIRLRPRGRLSPRSTRLSVRALELIDAPGDPPEPPRPWCEPAVDLLERLREGAAFPRMISPKPALVHFHLEPPPLGEGLAEVLFPVRPCEDACLFASVGVAADAARSDGVVFEVHLLHGEERPLLREVAAHAGAEVPLEIPIHAWPGEPQLLRFGARPGASDADDFAFVSAPRIGPCTARAWLAPAAAPHETAGSHDVVVPAGGATLRRSLHVIDSTCFTTRVDSSEQTPLGVRVAVDGLEHVLHDGPARGELVVGLHDWIDRDVTLIVDVGPSAASVRLIGPRLSGCDR